MWGHVSTMSRPGVSEVFTDFLSASPYAWAMSIDESSAIRFPAVVSGKPLVAVAALFAVPLVVFAALAAVVASKGDIVFDRPVMMWVNSVTEPWLVAVAQGASQLGGLVVPAAAGLIALVLCVLRRVSSAFLVVAAEFGASEINDTLKTTFQRSRPEFWEHLSVETTHSFPSGHAMATMALAAALLVVSWGTRYWRVVLAAAVVYVVSVGASRVILGVHFPSDVLAGWCLTLIWVGILVLFLRLVVPWISRRSPRIGAWL